MSHAWLDKLLLIWMLITLNIIHSWLVKIYVLEFVMSYIRKYVFCLKETKHINVKAFNIITSSNGKTSFVFVNTNSVVQHMI